VGVSRLFSPEYPDALAASEALMHLIHQSPEAYGQSGTRWTLTSLLAVGQGRGLRVRTVPGMCQIIRRLKVSRKRARHHVHSPDPHYVEKLGEVRVNLLRSGSDPEALVFLFEDEFTLYRHPSLALAYERLGKLQPLAELGWKTNFTWRIAAGLIAWTGQVTYAQARYMNIAQLTLFYQKLVSAYPGVEIAVVEDNWPVHSHADLLAALQPQTFPWGVHRPANWKLQARQQIELLNLPIRLLFLPTYASWTNPIEKLWRLLKQEVLHLHRYADDWPGLKQRVCAFLDQFAQGSQALLRYVGLGDPYKLYHSLFPEM
jgi:hypothetical protein